MITYSGILVLPDNQAAPTLEDIAVGLSRIVRWAGATRQSFTVLQHSLAVEMYAHRNGHGLLMRLHMLLHDAHEVVTGNIPTTWKPPAVKAMQLDLDRRIFRSIGLQPPDAAQRIGIQSSDLAILCAESRLIGRPGHQQYFSNMPGDQTADACVRTMLETRTSKISQVRRFLALIAEIQKEL